MVGGAGYVWGGVLGAAIVVILKEILQSYLPYIFHGEGQLETIVFGILLVVLLQLAPTGVWPWLMARLPHRGDRKRPDTSLTLPARARAAATPAAVSARRHTSQAAQARLIHPIASPLCQEGPARHLSRCRPAPFAPGARPLAPVAPCGLAPPERAGFPPAPRAAPHHATRSRPM